MHVQSISESQSSQQSSKRSPSDGPHHEQRLAAPNNTPSCHLCQFESDAFTTGIRREFVLPTAFGACERPHTAPKLSPSVICYNDQATSCCNFTAPQVSKASPTAQCLSTRYLYHHVVLLDPNHELRTKSSTTIASLQLGVALVYNFCSLKRRTCSLMLCSRLSGLFARLRDWFLLTTKRAIHTEIFVSEY